MGYHAPPGNILLISGSRLEKNHRKRLAMLKSCPGVPRIFFMQISDAITGKFIFHDISANNIDIWTNKVFTPMFWGSKNILRVFLNWLRVYLASNKQIGDAITEKSCFHTILANNADIWRNEVSRPMFWGSKSIKRTFIECLRVSLAYKIQILKCQH